MTEWNEASEKGWGRIRRWEKAMIPPDPSGSIVYEDSGLGFRVEFFGFRAGIQYGIHTRA